MPTLREHNLSVLQGSQPLSPVFIALQQSKVHTLPKTNTSCDDSFTASCSCKATGSLRKDKTSAAQLSCSHSNKLATQVDNIIILSRSNSFTYLMHIQQLPITSYTDRESAQ